MKDDKTAQFIDLLQESLQGQTFVKLTLANYKGSADEPQRILARLIDTKKGTRFFVQYKFATRDVVKNHSLDEGVEIVKNNLAKGFRNAHLFTTESDHQLEVGKKSARLHRGKPTFTTRPSTGHDRAKNDLIGKDAYYLKALGITTEHGEVKAQQQSKWRQINKFVEVIRDLYERSGLKEKQKLRIADMGSGKGYLTFAAYDYFTNTLKKDVEMVGVDTKTETVRLCNDIAKAGGFTGLRFEEGLIANADAEDVDILIALHACDTATDDALFKGISQKAEIILAAPCCHRELKKQMQPPAELKSILKHPVMLERTAEMITDGIRAMILEQNGYSTKIFEFVPTEHTPKNNMIAAVRTSGRKKDNADIQDLMAAYGIREQHLGELLKDNTEKITSAGIL
ncbi:MAG: SAM-dependent methyltransferase [Acidobacteria bacterium]|nr:SAM-dependent methyltransferase [Acidobacteriota bacterium]